jgi:hypothetical protein
MLSRMAAVVACVLFLGCATKSLSGPGLEAEFGGTWTGTATLALTGRNPVPYSVPLEVTALSGNTLSVANLCPGLVAQQSMRQSNMRLPTESARAPAPSVQANGFGGSASWSGTLECPRVDVSGCAGMAVVYTNLTLTLTGVNQLTVVATGNADGCSTNYPVVLTFVGAKSLSSLQ